jgi:hypothetical protein
MRRVLQSRKLPPMPYIDLENGRGLDFTTFRRNSGIRGVLDCKRDLVCLESDLDMLQMNSRSSSTST